MDAMNSLPDVTIDTILAMLPMNALARFSCSSKANREKADTDTMWFPHVVTALKEDYRGSFFTKFLCIGESSVHRAGFPTYDQCRDSGIECKHLSHYELDSLVYVPCADGPSLKLRCGYVWYKILNRVLPSSTSSLVRAIEARDAAIKKVDAIHKRKRLESVFNSVTGNEDRKSAKTLLKKARLEKKKVRLEEKSKSIALELAKLVDLTE